MLALHESVEEIVLYPVVRANFEDGHQLARLAIEQEAAIKDALVDLQAGDSARGHHLATLASRNRLRDLEGMLRVHHDLVPVVFPHRDVIPDRNSVPSGWTQDDGADRSFTGPRVRRPSISGPWHRGIVATD